MEKQSQPALNTTRRMDRALSHVEDLWFPVNEPLLERIQKGLQTGFYDKDIDALVQDIRSDFSLFTWCLREVARLVREEKAKLSGKTVKDPIDMLRQAGLEQLKAILQVEPSEISRHSFKASEILQSERLHEAMQSASASEKLAEGQGLQAELGFSAALFRQLGYTLIAWNYPGVYQQAISGLQTGRSLDLEIQQRLGFTPELLALKIVKNWGLPRELTDAIAADPEMGEDLKVSAIAQTLTKICDVSEALARANNPERYPSAQGDWERAKVEVEKVLGKEGMAMIRSTLDQNCRNYAENIPQIFKAGNLLDPELRIVNHRESDLLSKNPFITRSRPWLSARLKNLYARLVREGMHEENIQALTREIIPAAGFTAGYIFTIDPMNMRLAPQLKIKTPLLIEGEPMLIKDRKENFNCVREAFESDSPEPIIYTRALDDESKISAICGVFGSSQRMGVLYLEIPDAMFAEDSPQHILHFKALVQTLNDCLNLH